MSTTTLCNELDIFSSEIQDRPFQGLNKLVAFLDTKKYGPGDWRANVQTLRQHPVHHMLLEDPHTARAFSKPRGYAGDAVMMDFVYGHSSVASTMLESSDRGRNLARFSAGESYPARAVRWRRKRVAEEIEKLVQERGHIDVLAFAAGHLREFELVRPELRERVRFVAADADEAAVETVRLSYALSGSVECCRASVRELLAGKVKHLGKFDFAYTLGLLDYVSGRASGRVVECLWNMLKPGGRVFAGNFTTTTLGTGYMEAAMDWWLQYRHPKEVAGWQDGLDNVASSEVFEDPWKQIAYLLAQKAT